MKIPFRFRHAGRCLFTAACVPLLISIASADSDFAIQLEDYVITARRVAEDEIDVPSYAQVVTDAQIRASDATNLIDLLATEANLQFLSLSGSPANTKVSMRGTGTSGSGRTLVVLDGIRLNRPDMGDFNWLQFNLSDIASIEISQGPQGAFYGDNAVGGAIKINTNAAPKESGGGLLALGGSDGTLKLSAGYTELLGSAWVSATGGYDTSDGWRDHSSYTSKSATVGVGHDNQKNSITRLKVSYLDNDYEQPGFLTMAQLQQDPRQLGSSASDGWSDYRRVTLSNVFGASERIKLLTDAGASFVKEFYHGAWGTVFNRAVDTLFVSPKLRVVADAVTFTLGMDASTDDLHVVTTTPVNSTLKRRTLSPYVTAGWQATETIAWSAAWRHEWNQINAREDLSSQRSERTDDDDAFQLALNFRPTEGWHLYAKLDRTYRFPATDEISYYQGFGGGPTFTTFFNPNLKPEISNNLEVGAGYRRDAWRAGAAIYRLTTKDEIFYNGAVNLNENLAKTRREGLQLHASYDPGTWALKTRVDYVDAQLVRSLPGAGLIGSGDLRMTPKWRVTNSGVLRPREGLELNLTHTFIDGSLVDDSYGGANPGEVASVNLVDAKISQRLNERWRVFVGVNNLFDRTYVSYATIGYPPPFYMPTTVVYPGAGRTWHLGARVEF